jgi:hypothetical protein
LFELLGYTINFAVSVASLLIGILVLYWSFSRKKNVPESTVESAVR